MIVGNGKIYSDTDGSIKARVYRAKRMHPCQGCDKPCHFMSSFCRSCGGIVAAIKRGYDILKLTSCTECGKVVSVYKTKCAACTNRISGLNKRGENHPNWKGGRIQRKDGYVFIKMPENPRANDNGYILEHIAVWEQHNKKQLQQGWIIHHLNGIKGDNRWQNLVALSSHKHSRVIAAKAKRIQELEALLNNQGQLI